MGIGWGKEGLGVCESVHLGRGTGTTYVGGFVSVMEYYDPQVDYCIKAGGVVGDCSVGSGVGERTIFKRFGIVDTIGDIFGCLYLGQNSALTGVGNWPDSVMTIRSSALDLHNGVAYSGRFGAGFTDENWCFECDIVPMPIGVYPMTINNVTDFIAFRDAVNAGSQGQFKGVMNVNGFENQIVILRTDIDLQSVMNWQPIGTQTNPFKGQFIGLNHSVSNVQVQGMAHAALFGHVESATIGRVHVVSGAIQGSTQAAGLVAVAQDSEVLNCSNGASILSGSNGGGVVALALGNTSVKGCLNSGTVSVSAGGSFLGGVLGFAGSGAQVDVERCMNSGLIYSLYNLSDEG